MIFKSKAKTQDPLEEALEQVRAAVRGRVKELRKEGIHFSLGEKKCLICRQTWPCTASRIEMAKYELQTLSDRVFAMQDAVRATAAAARAMSKKMSTPGPGSMQAIPVPTQSNDHNSPENRTF